MKRIYLCKFAKRVLTVYERATSTIWISHKNQILIVLWLFEWEIVLIWIHSNSLHWKTFPFLKAFRMVKHVPFPDFSGILVFQNFIKGPIQYLVVQSQQWKHQNNVSNIFKVDNKQTRTTLMTLHRFLYFCELWAYSTYCSGIFILVFE